VLVRALGGGWGGEVSGSVLPRALWRPSVCVPADSHEDLRAGMLRNVWDPESGR
jgi:hypothetical protein